MFCPSCGATAQPGQRFCANCGASLVLVSVPPASATPPPAGSLAPPPLAPAGGAVPPSAPPPSAPPPSAAVPTEQIAIVAQTPVAGQAATSWAGPATEQVPSWERAAVAERRPPMLLAVVAGLAAVAGIVGAVTKLYTIDVSDIGASSLKISDLDNGYIVFFSAVVLALVGVAVAWAGHRLGAGLAGGAGLVIAGLAMPLIGLVVEAFDSALQTVPGEETITIVQTREIGFFGLIAMMVLGLVAFVVSLTAAGSDTSTRVHPGIVVAGVAASVVAGFAALLPSDGASFADNFSNEFVPPATLWLRVAALLLLVVAGVSGFVQARRWGMGMVLGGTVTWLLAAATSTSEFETNLTVGVFGPPSGELSPICLAALAVVVVAGVAGLLTSKQPTE